MKKILSLFILLLLGSDPVKSQSATKLYEEENYKELIKLEAVADKLSARELYYVGQAFFQLENDDKAVEFYDKAIKAGCDSGFVHYHKAISLRYAKKFDAAIRSFDAAISLQPKEQKYLCEKGFLYYLQDDLDKALSILLEAQKLENTYQDPFYLVPHIYHLKKENDKALKGFYAGLNHVSKSNKYYGSLLMDIGKLEFTYTKNYLKSAEAYYKALDLNPKNFEVHPKLMKSLNANQQYSKADSVFYLMKKAYEKKELPEQDMKYKNVAIHEYDWNGQTISIYRNFEDAKDPIDVSFKAYLLTKEGDKIERVFMIEKTIELDGGAKHLLCEKDKKNGGHITYGYGWNADIVPLEDFKKGLELVLTNKIKPAASSNFGGK